jgi:hypothetical protein
MNNFEMPIEQQSMLDNMGFNGHGVCVFVGKLLFSLFGFAHSFNST